MLLAGGIIRKSKSPWASNVVLARKKNGELRLCMDYRIKTLKDSYSLTCVEVVFDTLNGSTKSGYHQINGEESHKYHTASTVGPSGFFEYNKRPFGHHA